MILLHTRDEVSLGEAVIEVCDIFAHLQENKDLKRQNFELQKFSVFFVERFFYYVNSKYYSKILYSRSLRKITKRLQKTASESDKLKTRNDLSNMGNTLTSKRKSNRKTAVASLRRGFTLCIDVRLDIYLIYMLEVSR